MEVLSVLLAVGLVAVLVWLFVSLSKRENDRDGSF